MKLWSEYVGHKVELVEHTKKKVDSNIYTLDIETTSYIEHDGVIYPSIKYDELSKKEQSKCTKHSCMYIWMFGINDTVYYGRTWGEFRKFLERLNKTSPYLKIVFVHNLSFEFEFLKTQINFTEVYARKSHKPMKAVCNDYNIEFRCSLFMSNCNLAGLPKLFNLPVEKMVGDLDYTLLRHSGTPLTEKELGYCEHDNLVVYEYIKYELLTYKDVYHIPITSTGHVRRELQNKVRTNKSYKMKIRKAVNTTGHIYNLLLENFAGGFTHASYIYADRILKNVKSFDFCSSYPYCMVCFKYPMTKFRYINLKSLDEMDSNFAYLIKITFKNIRSKYNNNFISKSKCLNILNQVEDNGRVMSADSVTIVIPNSEFRISNFEFIYRRKP